MALLHVENEYSAMNYDWGKGRPCLGPNLIANLHVTLCFFLNKNKKNYNSMLDIMLANNIFSSFTHKINCWETIHFLSPQLLFGPIFKLNGIFIYSTVIVPLSYKNARVKFLISTSALIDEETVVFFCDNHS